MKKEENQASEDVANVKKKEWISPEMKELEVNSGSSFVAPESAFAASVS